MKYYKLGYDKVNYPMNQIEGVGGKVDTFGPLGVFAYDSLLKPKDTLIIPKPSFIPKWDYFIYYKRAKKFTPTDILSFDNSNNWIIISKRLFEILQDFKLSPYVFDECVIKQKNICYSDYIWMHFYSYNLENIDFEETFFYSGTLRDLRNNNIQEVDKLFFKFKSFTDFEIAWLNKKSKSILSDSIKLWNHFDLFNLNGIPSLRNYSVLYISDELKDAFIKHDITNFTYSDFSDKETKIC